jgi:hypothetical protein
MSADGGSLYVQSRSWSLWRVNVTGNATTLQLTGMWACAYHYSSGATCQSSYADMGEPGNVAFGMKSPAQQSYPGQMEDHSGLTDIVTYPFSTPSLSPKEDAVSQRALFRVCRRSTLRCAVLRCPL